jgi:hypothetical protein
MSKKERVNKAQDKALERLDYVIDCRETKRVGHEAVQAVGRRGWKCDITCISCKG